MTIRGHRTKQRSVKLLRVIGLNEKFFAMETISFSFFFGGKLKNFICRLSHVKQNRFELMTTKHRLFQRARLYSEKIFFNIINYSHL